MFLSIAQNNTMISKNRKNTREFNQKPIQNINRIYANKKAPRFLVFFAQKEYRYYVMGIILKAIVVLYRCK
jgi:hypothetical protein